MFSTSDIIYYLLFITAMTLSFIASKANIKGLIYLRVLFIVGLCTELIVDITDFYEVPLHNILYYIYIPFEYIILSTFLKKYVKTKRLHLIMTYALFIYTFLVIYFTFFYYEIENDYPGIIYNIGCVFLIIWTSVLLFNLEFKEDMKLFQIPFFWICTAMIIFYSGVFLYNGFYNYLLEEKTELASKLRLLVNLNLNYLFYILMSYAFICSIRQKKYFIR
ncbi:hypothetical protein ABW636_17080 [Aquimarina sp. 2201CG1-2-11]|uniref:hypothetical protein n=1 Tax=Aquimarina discodermiae TaxID=3231043 RepID=UPI0034622328